MRRVAVLIIAVALAAAACSTSSSPSAGPTGAPVGSAATPSPSPSPSPISGTITVWHYETTDPYIKLLNDEAKLFNTTYPNVTVKYVQVPFADMTAKLLATAAAKQGPDVAIFQFGDVQSLVKAGVLQDMNSYWSSFADASKFSPAVVQQVNGKVYSAQAYVNLIALYYNKDILDKYSIAPPTTMDEFEAALAKVTAGGDGGLAIDGKSGVDGWWTGMPFFFGAGEDIHMSGPNVASTFARVRSWVDKGYVSKEAVTWDQDTVFNKFMTGKFAFAVGGNWYASNATKATFKYSAAPIPPAAQPSSVYVGGEGEAIGAFTQNADLAWAYLQATWFSKAGQILALNAVGTLPTRSDAAQDPAIASSPILPAFAAAVQTGKPLPITTAENNASTVFGDLWSAVLSGQKTPQQAASELAAKIPGILK